MFHTCVRCGIVMVPKKGIKQNTCEDCWPKQRYLGPGVPTNLEYTDVPGYGKVLKSRLKEMKRRVILPIEPDPKSGVSYYVGRRGDNGKIQEITPKIGG